MHWQELLVRFGLIAVFLGAALEGTASMILAGVFAHLGFFGLSAAIGLGAVGRLAGDSGWYAIGRHGADWIRATRVYRHSGPWISRIADRLGPWQIPLSHFVYGTRWPTMVFWGTRHLSYPRFVLVDVLACAAWSAAFATLGYMTSHSAEGLVRRVRRAEIAVVLAIVMLVLVYLASRLVLRRRRNA